MESSQSFLVRHDFWLRRLHSLTGVVPIGAFLMVHLTTNSSIVWGVINGSKHEGVGHPGVVTFQHEVDFIHSLPFLILIEVFGLWLPIAFHSILGMYYAAKGRPNNGSYKYAANWRYTLQRVSAWVGLIFIFYHVATLRWGWTFLVPGGTRWDAEYAASTLVAALHGGTGGIEPLGYLVGFLYMAGVTLLVFHLANGLWTAAITWGLTVSAGAQRRWGYVCAGLGAALMLAAWSAVIGFYATDYHEARSAEESHRMQKKLEQDGVEEGELVLLRGDGRE
ncbi:MAG: succinate dehydrogenase cytochrome b558 subunit [Phycisphaerales bacterium]